MSALRKLALFVGSIWRRNYEGRTIVEMREDAVEAVGP